MKRVYKLVCLLALLAICPSSLLIAQTSFVLTGTIVTARGIVNDGTILVVNGRIRDIGTNIAVPEGTPLLKVDGVIFPGLIDLHNHLAWNVLPRWSLPNPVSNRYEWQAMPEYVSHLARPEREMMARGEGCDMERYAEIKALLGGATSVTGSFASSDDTKSNGTKNNCVKGLVRKLDVFSGLYPQRMNAEPLLYEIFPLELPWQEAQAIRDKLASREVKAVICHVGEGKDASARREFSMFAARGFLRPGVTIIHGVALGRIRISQNGG
jgi:5-methylthioadenosine/S-adenosylhomocysteine deaminase